MNDLTMAKFRSSVLSVGITCTHAGRASRRDDLPLKLYKVKDSNKLVGKGGGSSLFVDAGKVTFCAVAPTPCPAPPRARHSSRPLR
jgi:hypothetical protein